MNQSADESQEALINEFIEITGVDRDRARFYLDTANFDIALALSGYYEGGFDDEGLDQPEVIFDSSEDEVQVVEEPKVDQSTAGSRRANRGRPLEKEEEMSGGKKSDEKKKFATLFGGSSGGPESPSSGSEDDERGQAFYVGGSEKSGQQVLGPPKKKADNLVDKFFQQAKERGAEQIDASQRGAAASASGGSKSLFTGAGYRLGDAVKPSEKVGGGMEVDSDAAEPEIVTVVLRMWRNGFTIDDEPFRGLEAPADRQFLEQIMQGRIPTELVHAHRGKRIDLEMEDHRHEEYKPLARPLKAFTGQGHTLGSPVPEVVGAGKVGAKPAAAAAANGASATPTIDAPPVDETKPITNIQVRLGNGERLVMKMNHTHTVKDLRDFICRMRPDLANRSFVLMTNFPNKELTDESATLEASNLLNAVIIQRFK